MRHLILIAHNIRSCLNVGSLLRTAEGLGVDRVYLTGYTPYPLVEHDSRLPHEARQITHRINKSALGAETMVPWAHVADINDLLPRLQADGYSLVALEQNARAIDVASFKPPEKIAVIVGREVEGIEHDILAQCDAIVEIPMAGRKESFNVAVAAAIALYAMSCSA